MAVFPKKGASRGDGKTQTIAVGAASVQAGARFAGEVYQIRLVSNVACHYQVGDASATASQTASPFLPANMIEYVIVSPGQTIAAIQAATNGLVTATAGTMWITEVS